jgi:hypothetical protein
MNKAKKMLLASFLACVALGTGSALMACGGTTSSGGTSTPDSSTTSTPEAWELENAAVVYTVDKDGVETANYTVKGKNGEEYTKSVATGRKVVDIDEYSMKVNGEACEGFIETTVDNAPKIEVLATFNDDTKGWVTIADDMYVGAKPDYTKAGLYTAQIKLLERLSAYVLVKGDEPVVIETMLLNEQMMGMSVLWDKADVVAGTYDVSTVFWGHYTYVDGVESQAVVNATAEQIKPIDWTAESEEGVYNFSVTDANGNSGVLQAYVLDAESETEITVMQRQLGSFTMMEQMTAVKDSEISAIDTSDMLAMEMLMIGTDAMAMRMVELPEGVEYTLDTSECGDQELTATWTVGEGDDAEELTATTSVLVYENKEEVVEVSEIYVNSYKAVESGVADIEFEIYSYTQYTAGTGDDKAVLTTTGGNYETVVLTADMIKGTAPDFTTAGVKVFTVEFGENEYTYAVELWAEEKAVATTTNIASIALPEELTFVKDSVNIELYVRTEFVNGSYDITYIEPVNGYYEDYVTLKVNAFDWSDVKMDTVGEYEITVTYEGYEQTITVNVVEEMPEVEEPETVAMFDVWDFEFSAVVLYSDNTADLRVGFGPYGELVKATYTLDETTGTIEFKVDDAKYAIGTVVVEDEQIVGMMPYTFGEPTAEYTIIYFGEEQTLKLYEEGYGECVSEWGYATFSGAYTLKDGLLTIAGNKFYIQGTGADAKVIEVKTANN